MSMIIDVDTSDYDSKIERVRVGVRDFIPRFIQDGTQLIQTEMADTVPVKTGALRASVSSDISERESITGTHTGYGLFVDQPTAPHVIRPNISKFLRFEIGGQVVYARQVFHPGTKGAFFIDATLSKIVPQLSQLAATIWRELTGGS